MLSEMEAAQKTYESPVSDSARWAAFEPRAGDIVVNTPPKSGTTWIQGILAMLITGDPETDAEVSVKSPWIDVIFRPIEDVTARLAAQDHRRQVKSHTPYDGIPYWQDLRYISVYRHPIDIHFSFRNHVKNFKFDLMKDLYPDDPRESFRIFLQDDNRDEASLRGIVTHFKETLARDQRENLIRLHYKDMLQELSKHVALIANHIGISHAPDVMAAIVKAATFDSMKANAHRFAPAAGQGVWKQDAGFFESAASNKWEGVLTDADIKAYDTAISKHLTDSDRAWLEWGSVGTSRP